MPAAAAAPPRATSELALHLAIYAGRPDVGAIIHTHSPHATAWSCIADELVLLRRHGAVTVGADLADARCVAESLEHQAHVAWILRDWEASPHPVAAASLSPPARSFGVM